MHFIVFLCYMWFLSYYYFKIIIVIEIIWIIIINYYFIYKDIYGTVKIIYHFNLVFSSFKEWMFFHKFYECD